MKKSEELFCIDSTVILQILENSENDEMRFVHLFKWLTQMISSFNFEDKKLLDFLDSLQTQFKEEFNADKNVRKELSATYRRLETKLLTQDKAVFLNKNNLKEVVATFLNAEKEQKLEVSLESLLASFIHMSVNRCFRSKQRLHEMLLYDFLYKKNKSKFMRYGNI
jgi:thiopeptide-type bacteriocin biosynthesis protein